MTIVRKIPNVLHRADRTSKRSDAVMRAPGSENHTRTVQRRKTKWHFQIWLTGIIRRSWNPPQRAGRHAEQETSSKRNVHPRQLPGTYFQEDSSTRLPF